MVRVEEEKEPKRPVIKRSDLVALGIIAVCFAAIVVFGVWALTPSPTFCGTCHSREIKAWKASNHKSVPCNLCHTNAGALGSFAQRVKVLQMTNAYLTGLYDRPISAQVSNKSCDLCHSELERKTVTRNGIRVSHKEIVEAGYDCTECHNQVSHGKSVPTRKTTNMDKCALCHNYTKASAECEICHVQTVKRERAAYLSPWRITHGKNWRQTHGMGNLATCRICHSERYCMRCHDIELPHPDGWENAHGWVAVSRPDNCGTCHRKALCNSCHSMEMPHPGDFLQKHSAIVKKEGQEACAKCHMLVGCDECHRKHIHPGLPQSFLRNLRRDLGLE